MIISLAHPRASCSVIERKVYKLPVMENLSMAVTIRIALLSMYQCMVSDFSFVDKRIFTCSL
jgi:hypothetical protein